MLDANAIWWTASTVAQSVVVLLAFAGFIALWKRDNLCLTRRHAPTALLDSVQRLGNTTLDISKSKRPLLANWLVAEGHAEKVALGALGVQEGWHCSTQNLDRVLTVARAILAQRSYLLSVLGADADRLSDLTTQANATRQLADHLGRLQRGVRRLALSVLLCFTISVMSLALATPMTCTGSPDSGLECHAPLWGLALQGALVGSTVVVVVATSALVKAVFREPGSSSSP